jgi:hypothetical protein
VTSSTDHVNIQEHVNSKPHIFPKIQSGFLSFFFIFIASRLAILAIAFISYHNFQLELEPDKAWSTHIEELWSKFDVLWYKDITLNGYEALPFSTEEKRNWAFLPLYPLTVKALILPFSDRAFFFVASLFSSLLTFLALYLIVDIFKDRIQNKNRFFFLYLISAGSFYLSIPYTESLALFLLACTFYFTQKKHYFWAAVMAGLGAITRIQCLGLLLIPLLSLLSENRMGKKTLKTLVVLTLFSIPLLVYMGYLKHLTGNPLAFFDMQQSWGNHHPYPLAALLLFIGKGTENNPCQWLHLSMWALFAACFIRNYKKIPLNELVFCIVVFLISTGSEKFWGAYRYVLMLIPLYIALSNEEEWFRKLYIYSNLLMGSIYTNTFVNTNGFAI